VSLAALVLIWGTTWAAIRVGLQGIPPLTGVALRFTIAGLALLALVPVFKVRLGATRRERLLWLCNAFFTFCVSYSILYWAEQWVPSGLAAVLFATFPLIVALLAHFLLPGERLTWAAGFGILVGFAGVAVIFSEDFRTLLGPQVVTAATVLLLCPLCSAIGSVAVKKWGGGIHPLSTAAVPMLLCGLVIGPLSRLTDAGRPVHFTGPATLALLYLALIGSALPFTLYFWLLKHNSATRMSLINYAVPIVAVIVGHFAFDEPVTLRVALGAALVIVGTAVTVRKGAEREPSA